jgi:Cof subfamily protein (haloacid dehalogenase superfamily)
VKNQQIRVLATDVDGTLLDSSHRLRAEVRDALRQLAASGVQLVLATARGPGAVSEIIRQLAFSPWLICFSGAWIGQWDPRLSMPESILLDKRIPSSAAESIVTLAARHNVEPGILTPDVWRVRTITPEFRLESQIIDSRPQIAADLLAGIEPSKILLITPEGEPASALERIASLIGTLSSPTFSKPNYLEILPLGVNKAKALVELGKSLGVELSQVAAIGDGPNDVEMLCEAGLGIAMGNASDEVKAVADWVSVTNDEGGVAHAVRRLFPKLI